MEQTMDILNTLVNDIERKPKKIKNEDIFIIEKKISHNSIKHMPSSHDLQKKTVPELKKLAKASGLKNYSTYRKAGLISVLSQDNKHHFTVPSKGQARVGAPKGARLAFDALPKKPKRKIQKRK